MKRLTQLAALVAALAFSPALAYGGAPRAGSAGDRAAKTYTERHVEHDAATPCDRSCPCGHHRDRTPAAQEDAGPRFTDAG